MATVTFGLSATKSRMMSMRKAYAGVKNKVKNYFAQMQKSP